MDRERIDVALASMAGTISRDYAGRSPLFVSVLNGAFMFTSDLLKRISINCEVTFIRVSSYSGTESTGSLTGILGLKENILGRDLIILEDIIDTGLTMRFLLDELAKQKPASVRIAALLFKKEALKTDIRPDYVGFEIPMKFVVGYGLDFDGAGRNLPDIYEEKR